MSEDTPKPAPVAPEQPVVNDVAPPPTEATQPAKPVPEATQPPQQSAEPPDSTAEVSPPAKKSSVSLPVIIAAFAVCAALIGLSVYMAVSESSKSDSITKDLTASNSQQKTQPQTSTPDIQGAIDETATLPAATDEVSPQLTDQALGL